MGKARVIDGAAFNLLRSFFCPCGMYQILNTLLSRKSHLPCQQMNAVSLSEESLMRPDVIGLVDHIDVAWLGPEEIKLKGNLYPL